MWCSGLNVGITKERIYAMDTEALQKSLDEMSFNEASQALEQVVRSLESGDLELEQALDTYAKGVALLKNLQTRLTNAEQKVAVLTQDLHLEEIQADTTSAPATAFMDTEA